MGPIGRHDAGLDLLVQVREGVGSLSAADREELLVDTPQDDRGGDGLTRPIARRHRRAVTSAPGSYRVASVVSPTVSSRSDRRNVAWNAGLSTYPEPVNRTAADVHGRRRPIRERRPVARRRLDIDVAHPALRRVEEIAVGRARWRPRVVSWSGRSGRRPRRCRCHPDGLDVRLSEGSVVRVLDPGLARATDPDAPRACL